MTQQEFDSHFTLGALGTKKSRLVDRLSQKKSRLSGLPQNDYANLDDSTTVIDGALFSNSNKIWNKDTAAQKQQKFSDAIDQQVYKRDDSSMYQIDPFSGSEIDYIGDTRRLYMYGTKADDNEIKLGLAKSGFNTSDIRYDRQLATKLGASKGSGYGWESGSKGVDTNKKHLDVLLPFDVATEFEAYSHGNIDALKNRTVLRNNEQGRIDRGSGSSEYYRDSKGLFGDTSDVDYSNKYDGTTDYTNFLGKLNDRELSRNQKIDKKIAKLDSGLIDAVQASTVKLYGNFTSGVGTVLEKISKNFDSKDIAEAGTFLVDRNKFIQKNANKYYGFYSNNEGKLTGIAKNLVEGDYGKAWDGIAEVNWLEQIAESAPMMVALGNPVTSTAMLLGNIDEAVQARRLNQEDKISGSELASIVVAESLSLLTEKLALKGVLGDDAFNVIKPMLGKASPSIIKTAVQELTARGGAIVGAGALLEGTQEVVQGTLDVIGEKYNTKKYDTMNKAFEGRLIESIAEFIGGAGAGGVMKGAFDLQTVPNTVVSYINQRLILNQEKEYKKYGASFESIEDAESKIIIGEERILEFGTVSKEIADDIDLVKETSNNSELLDVLKNSSLEKKVLDDRIKSIQSEDLNAEKFELIKNDTILLMQAHQKGLDIQVESIKTAIQSTKDTLSGSKGIDAKIDKGIDATLRTKFDTDSEVIINLEKNIETIESEIKNLDNEIIKQEQMGEVENKSKLESLRIQKNKQVEAINKLEIKQVIESIRIENSTEITQTDVESKLNHLSDTALTEVSSNKNIIKLVDILADNNKHDSISSENITKIINNIIDKRKVHSAEQTIDTDTKTDSDVIIKLKNDIQIAESEVKNLDMKISDQESIVKADEKIIAEQIEPLTEEHVKAIALNKSKLNELQVQKNKQMNSIVDINIKIDEEIKNVDITQKKNANELKVKETIKSIKTDNKSKEIKPNFIKRIFQSLDPKASDSPKSIRTNIESKLKNLNNVELIEISSNENIAKIVDISSGKDEYNPISIKDVTKIINNITKDRKDSNKFFSYKNIDEVSSINSKNISISTDRNQINNNIAILKEIKDLEIKKTDLTTEQKTILKEDGLVAVEKIKQIAVRIADSIMVMSDSEFKKMAEDKMLDDVSKDIGTIKYIDSIKDSDYILEDGRKLSSLIKKTIQYAIDSRKKLDKKKNTNFSLRQQVMNTVRANNADSESINKARANLTILENKGNLDKKRIEKLSKMLNEVEARSKEAEAVDQKDREQKEAKNIAQHVKTINKEIDADTFISEAEKDEFKSMPDAIKIEMANAIGFDSETIMNLQILGVTINTKDGTITVEHNC